MCVVEVVDGCKADGLEDVMMYGKEIVVFSFEGEYDVDYFVGELRYFLVMVCVNCCEIFGLIVFDGFFEFVVNVGRGDFFVVERSVYFFGFVYWDVIIRDDVDVFGVVIYVLEIEDDGDEESYKFCND